MSDELVLAADIETLTDEQRAAITAFFEEHPDGGLKHACRAAGIRATKDEAARLIKHDSDLREARLVALGLDEGSLFARLGEMAQDAKHPKQFEALRFGLGAIHRYGPRVEVTGEDGGPVEVNNPDVAAAVDRFTALADAAIRAASRTRTEPASLEP